MAPTLLALEEIENAVKLASDKKAVCFKTYGFSIDTPWAVTTWKSKINPKRFDLKAMKGGTPDHLPNWDGLKNVKDYVKDWNVLISGSVDWIEVDNIGLLPKRLISQFVGVRDVDERETDFEVNYFGYNFDIKTMEKLFDRKRFNNANIKEDFPIESILQQAETAKKGSFETKVRRGVKK